jgi:hypothetical protein
VGAIAARTRTELAERCRLPDTRITNRGFLTAVRAMLTLLVEWNAARQVPGLGVRSVPVPPVVEGVAPPTSGGVAPAA